MRQPSGSTVTGIVPTNTYLCRDGNYVVIGGNGDSIYKRLMRTAERPDLADDPRLASNDGRVEHESEIDQALADWCGRHELADVLARLEEARVPSGPIYSVQDMFEDPHFEERGLFESQPVEGRELKLGAIQPKLSRTPGRTEWAGPSVGAHNAEVLGHLLGLDDETLTELADAGVI